MFCDELVKMLKETVVASFKVLSTAKPIKTHNKVRSEYEYPTSVR